MQTIVSALCLLLAAVVAHAQQPNVDELLSRMTLEEKLGQLNCFTDEQPEFQPAVAKGLVGSVLNSRGAAYVNQIQRSVLAGSRLKIPILVGYDVIHGYRTIFPIPLAIASSWDPQLAELSAHVAATEARAAGIRWTYAPMVDIARDARWGRIAEGAGEDPVLGAVMAAAYVRGFQGSGLLACAKHYAAYGAAEGGRDYDAASVSERQLREVYLPPFRAAVDAGVATIMSAFESVDGIPATANHHLLDDILRREWKFKGFVVSDWDAVAELIHHGVAASKEEAARKAIAAGVDVDMWDNAYTTLAAAVREGRLPPAVVDRAVRRVLRLKLLAGLFDDPFTNESVAPAMNRDAARRVGQRSIVLLKNEGAILPLPKSGRTFAVIGPLADSQDDMLGPWAAQGKAEESVTALEGIRAAVADASKVHYARGDDVPAAVELARNADVTIAILGETRQMSGEASSRASLDLPGQQEQLLESLAATGKPVVLVVMSGRPLAIAWAAEHVPAIVEAWFLGSESGHALADVLFGDVNPSGKLPVTVPRTTGQVPIYYAHLPTGRPADPEDKYTSKYLDVPIGPLYPFGFGLSYTRFSYSNLNVSESLQVSADIRNDGDRAGEEIVQLYVAEPAASVSRPVKELKAFQRVSLKPGESRRVEFTITRRDLRFWSNGRWVVEPGEFRVWIAPDSASGPEGRFVVKQRPHPK